MPTRWRIPAKLLLAAATAGCSIGDNGSPQSPLAPNPPDLAAVTKAAMGIFVNLKLPGSPEISALRPAHPSSLADWMFCLRSDADDIPRDYALFVLNAQSSATGWRSRSTPAPVRPTPRSGSRADAQCQPPALSGRIQISPAAAPQAASGVQGR